MQHQGPFCFSLHHVSEDAGGVQELGRGHSQDSWTGTQPTPLDQRDVPHHDVPCSAITAGGEGARGNIWRDGIFLKVCL